MIDWDRPSGLLLGAGIYVAVLLLIARRTGRNASNAQFFLASRQANWLLIAIGMIGTTLSGITFTSIPGLVGSSGSNRSFSYALLVGGYVIGYAVIAMILLPLYYQQRLTSIYGYLGKRFGLVSQRTASAIFLISQLLVAALRILLFIEIVHIFALGEWGIPFAVTAFVSVALIYAYTFRGGIHTLIWTDLFQTGFMLFAVGWSFVAAGQVLGGWSAVAEAWTPETTRIFLHDDWRSNAWQLIQAVAGGALITIAMTGLDQDNMQKNLACRTLVQSQRNVALFTGLLVLVNWLFLMWGAVLYLVAAKSGAVLPAESDLVFPTVAFQHLTVGCGAIFVLGLLAATFSGSDASLTAVTTTTCVDFLGFSEGTDTPAYHRARMVVHVLYALLLFALIVLLHQWMAGQATIHRLLSLVGLSYGPLLGLFAFGLVSRKMLWEPLVPLVCLMSPPVCWWLETRSWFCGVQLGTLLILPNALLTVMGLWLISRPEPARFVVPRSGPGPR